MASLEWKTQASKKTEKQVREVSKEEHKLEEQAERPLCIEI